jgi:hypothetical protein
MTHILQVKLCNVSCVVDDCVDCNREGVVELGITNFVEEDLNIVQYVNDVFARCKLLELHIVQQSS